MKAKKQKERLDMKIRVFQTDRAIQDAISKHPGSFHQPESFKKC